MVANHEKEELVLIGTWIAQEGQLAAVCLFLAGVEFHN
jgi:hypothetical protein